MHSFINTVFEECLCVLKTVAIVKCLETVCKPSKIGMIDMDTLFKREKH